MWPPRALPALALVVCDARNSAVRLVRLNARLGAAAAREFGRVGGGGAEVETAETRGIGGNALADAEVASLPVGRPPPAVLVSDDAGVGTL